MDGRQAGYKGEAGGVQWVREVWGRRGQGAGLSEGGAAGAVVRDRALASWRFRQRVKAGGITIAAGRQATSGCN